MSDAQGPQPRPQYGEYADPGENQGAPAAQPGDDRGESAPAASVAPPAAVPSVGRLPGVPHNLGVSGAARAATPAQSTPTSAPQPPPRAQQAPMQQAPMQQQAATPQPAAAPAKRSIDRIITVLLLGVGAYGALNLGFSLLQLRAQVALAAEILKLENFVVPQQVGTIGTVGAIAVLALYALTLIFSIRRMRARKLTFWAPLAAGAIAFLVFVAAATIAYVQSPELVQAMAQPDAIQAIFDYAESQ